MPDAAIFSRSNSIVAGQGRIEREDLTVQCIESASCLRGADDDLLALHVIADRPVPSEGQWQQVECAGPRRRRITH